MIEPTIPEGYFRISDDALEAQRQFHKIHNWLMSEMQNKCSVAPFPFAGNDWPEVVYEDVLDMEILDA